jgi:hypothetical protein
MCRRFAKTPYCLRLFWARSSALSAGSPTALAIAAGVTTMHLV